MPLRGPRNALTPASWCLSISTALVNPATAGLVVAAGVGAVGATPGIWEWLAVAWAGGAAAAGAAAWIGAAWTGAAACGCAWTGGSAEPVRWVAGRWIQAARPVTPAAATPRPARKTRRELAR